MATGSESRIDTKLFAATAQTLGDIAKQLDGRSQEWNKTIGALRGVWQGDASDNIRNTAEQAQKSAEELVRALAGYQAALNEMAGIYDKNEQTMQESGKSLRFDKAFR